MPATNRATNPQPAEDAPGPRGHEDTWGANPDAKAKFAADNPAPAKSDTAEGDKK